MDFVEHADWFKLRGWMRACGCWLLLVGAAFGAASAEAEDPALVRSRRTQQPVPSGVAQRQAASTGTELIYAFFPDVAYTVTVSRIEQGYGGTVLASGQTRDGRDVTYQSVTGPDGERLTLRDRSCNRLYQGVILTDGGWEFREYDLSRELPRTPMPPLRPPDATPLAMTEPIPAADTPADPEGDNPVLPMATTAIDVMVVYDTTAQSWVAANGGMTNFAIAAVARMNLAMATTGIDCTFRLVHTVAKAYTYDTAGTLSAPLYAITDGTGVFSDIAAIRTAYAADLVTILVDTGSAYGYVGLGWLLSSTSGNSSYAFTACAIRSVNQSHTLTHEAGHNLGCGHAVNQVSDPGPSSLYTYASGYYFTASSINRHTIMAYNNDGYGNYYYDTDFFSTPLKTYGTSGVVVGDASTADNARVIRNTMGVISQYKTLSAPSRPTGVSATDGSSTAATVVSWTPVLGDTSNTVWRSTASSSSGSSRIGASTGSAFADQTGTPGAIYYYWVKAVNAAGSSSFNNGNESGYRALEAPSALAASGGLLTGGVTVRWDAVKGASHYRVYRAASAAGSKTTLGSWQTGLTYSDISAAAGSLYYYCAQAAVNSSGLRPSGYSDANTGFWMLVAPAISGIVIAPGGVDNDPVLEFNAQAGFSYHVLEKNNLADAFWTTNTTLTPAADGLQSVQLPRPADKTSGFYRLEIAP